MKPRPGAWITPERDKLLLAYQPGARFRETYNAVCALPGPPPPSYEACQYRCCTLRATTIERRLAAARAGATTRREQRTARCELPPVPARELVDWPTFVQRAAALGIQVRDWEDMPAVNDRAERAGIPGFKRKFR